MSLVTHSFDLSIMPGSISPVLHLSQYDDARTFVAHLKDDTGAAFVLPAGSTATLHGVNSKRVAFDLEADVSGSDITFTPKEAATDQPGKIRATLCIKAGTEQLTPLLVILDVQKDGATHEEIARSPGFTDAISEAVESYFDEHPVIDSSAISYGEDTVEDALDDLNERIDHISFVTSAEISEVLEG